MLGNRDHPVYTEDTPDYDLFSEEMLKTVGLGFILLTINIYIMIKVGQHPIAEQSRVLFKYSFVGILVFGVILSLGRYLALTGVETIGSNKGNLYLVLGMILLMGGYGLFGGMVLSLFSEDIWIEAIKYTFILVLAITLIVSVYVFKTKRDLSRLNLYSGVFFLSGFLMSVVGEVFPSLLLVTFAFFIIGFLLDLAWELYMVSSGRRSTIANGIGVYVAVTGLFVHLLQIILRAMAER